MAGADRKPCARAINGTYHCPKEPLTADIQAPRTLMASPILGEYLPRIRLAARVLVTTSLNHAAYRLICTPD
jgi:hypothetical protein